MLPKREAKITRDAHINSEVNIKKKKLKAFVKKTKNKKKKKKLKKFNQLNIKKKKTFFIALLQKF